MAVTLADISAIILRLITLTRNRFLTSVNKGNVLATINTKIFSLLFKGDNDGRGEHHSTWALQVSSPRPWREKQRDFLPSCTSDLRSSPLAPTIVQAMLSKCWIKNHANLAGSSAQLARPPNSHVNK